MSSKLCTCVCLGAQGGNAGVPGRAWAAMATKLQVELRGEWDRRVWCMQLCPENTQRVWCETAGRMHWVGVAVHLGSRGEGSGVHTQLYLW